MSCCVAEYGDMVHSSCLSSTFIFTTYFVRCGVCVAVLDLHGSVTVWEHLPGLWCSLKGTHLHSEKPQSCIYNLTKEWNAINNLSASCLQSWQRRLSCSGCIGRHTFSFIYLFLFTAPVSLCRNINPTSIKQTYLMKEEMEIYVNPIKITLMWQLWGCTDSVT